MDITPIFNSNDNSLDIQMLSKCINRLCEITFIKAISIGFLGSNLYNIRGVIQEVGNKFIKIKMRA